jgi:chromosome segregation ATPase
MTDSQPEQPASSHSIREEPQSPPSHLGGAQDFLAFIDELTAQLEANHQALAQQLQQAEQARDEQAARVTALESELAALMAELDFEQRIKKVEGEAKPLETAYDFELKS